MAFGKADIPNFDPADPIYRRRLWAVVTNSYGSPRLVVFWRRLFLALLALLVLLWCTGAGAMYLFFRLRHNFTEASYLNLVLPTRWPLHREALGRHYIKLAYAMVKNREFNEAYYYFAAGLARVPTDMAARRELATLNYVIGLPHIAVNMMVDGLEYSRDNLDYLKFTFNLLFEFQDDRRALEQAVKYLPKTRDEVRTHQYLALQAATALFNRGHYDAAEQMLAAWTLERSAEGQVLIARCDWERGYPELALVRLRSARDRFPDKDVIPLELIKLYRSLNDYDSLLNEAVLRYLVDPASPGPRIDLLYARHYKADHARLNRELESYLADFPRDPRALLQLGYFANDTANLPLAQRLYAIAVREKIPLNSFALVLIQVQAANGRFQEAFALCEATKAASTANNELFSAQLSGLRALASYGAGNPNDGDLYLKAFLAKNYLRANDAMILAHRFEEISAPRQARQILETAVRYDPRNQHALTALLKFDTESGNLEGIQTYLPRLLVMRKPSRTVLLESYLKLDDSTPARTELRRRTNATLRGLTSNPLPEN